MSQRQQQAPAGGFTKRHVSGMLKYLADEEQQAKALEVAAAFKKLFAEKQWEPVLAKIHRIAGEDHLRVVSRRRPARLMSAGQALPAANNTSALSVGTDVKAPLAGVLELRSSSSMLPLGRSRAPSTPREKWDVTSRGPATPLSPTPTGNAFAGGGFWEQLTPKTPVPPTPVTAVPHSPFSPVVPQNQEARAAYNHVKKGVEAMARTVCASRMSIYSTISSDHIPNNLLRSKDLLKGAQLTLQYRQVNLQLAIDPGLPRILRTLAAEEAQMIRQYSIKDTFELLDLDMWLQVDTQPHTFTTLLDAQRELVHVHRNRRKSKILKLSDQAIQQAWATRILEDAEHVAETDGDDSSIHSDEDKGYDYNKFLRSIKSEVSSSSDLASMSGGRSCTDLSSLRSSGTNIDSFPSLSRETTFASQRSSTSPRKPYGLPLRSRENSCSNSPSPEKHASGTESSRALSRSRTTTFIKEEDEDSPGPQLSPEEKAFRHKGASHTDLDQWAQQLKQMEERQIANKNKVRSSHFRQNPGFRSTPRNRQRSADSAESWKCEDAARHERKSSMPSSTAGRNDESPPKIRSPTYSGSRRPGGYASTVPLPPSPSSSTTPSRPTSPTRSQYTVPPLPQGYKHATSSHASLHNSVRHKQHVRSKSSLARAAGVEEEDDWTKELTRMESKERMRQQQEEMRRPGSRLSREKGGGREEEWK
jgi:hypothetical protein